MNINRKEVQGLSLMPPPPVIIGWDMGRISKYDFLDKEGEKPGEFGILEAK